jgi:hypothetical protein
MGEAEQILQRGLIWKKRKEKLGNVMYLNEI